MAGAWRSGSLWPETYGLSLPIKKTHDQAVGLWPWRPLTVCHHAVGLHGQIVGFHGNLLRRLK